MSGGSNLEHIDAVDAFARTLYVSAKQSGPPFEDVAAAVRQLHIVLRHLRVEAADPDSLLNNPDASIYGRKLGPMLEDCDFTLKTLDTLLEKYGNGKHIDNGREVADRAAVIKSKLMGDRTNLDIFLDTVQLHNPANKPDRVVDGNQGGLEGIKDKVDEIATRLFQRREGQGFAEDEDSLWQEFKAELEQEGFSPHVLRKHKDVLRAYIRELEFMSSANGGTCPTVRGLLEHEAKSRPTSPGRDLAVIDENRHPNAINIERPSPHHAVDRRYSTTSSEHSGSDSSESMALISTKELMAMDSLNARMSRFHLQPPGHDQYQLSGSAPTTKYLPHNVAGALPGPGDDLSASPTSQFGASPRFVPPVPGYVATGPQAPPGPNGAMPRAFSRLAPDRYGNEIPADAQWTRIKRTLVSPEVLERAGVRYEARPEYVAILGRLSKEEIAEFARQSAAARAARNYPRRYSEDDRRRSRSDSRSSEEDDESDPFDESDSTDDDDDKTSEKGHKSYLHVVDPPEKKTSPSSTVQPKPILKNKNENHVRFDPEPHELEPKSPHSLRDDRDRSRRHRPPPPGFRRHRDPHRRNSDTSYRDDREYYHDNRSTGRRHHRDRERRGSRRDDREPKKKWGSALGAVGIGGAAATLLSVLAEAASVV